MTNPRIENLQRMLDRHPDDARLRFGLALEYEKAGRWQEAVEQLERYLEQAEDEGNAWGRLGEALRRLGRDDDARDAYRRGIEAATRHHHPTMADEFREILQSWNDAGP
ncbi:MAG: tetratricopeptide repeat protein [Longimicrobiales bacterium]|nr:tetratricopeptide repeat protein [Longimicrobiales bacterium]